MAVQQSNLEIVQKIQSASIDFANVFYLIAKQQYLLRELGAQKEMYQTLLAEMNSTIIKIATIDDTIEYEFNYYDTIDQEVLVKKDLDLAILDFHQFLNLSTLDPISTFDIEALNVEDISKYD